MKFLILSLLIIGVVALFSVMNSNVIFGDTSASSNFCRVFPTYPECSGWRTEAIYDNFWFCEYVDLPTMCNNPPDPQKQVIPITDSYCCSIIGSHIPKNMSLDDTQFADTFEKGQTLDVSSSQELVVWTEKDHYSFGDRVNIYGKFNFDDPVLKNANQSVNISINDRTVILDLPVHSNGWFAGYFVLSNPYLYYTGYNLISVEYFHTPTQHNPNKITHASYTITTGDIVPTESFFINDLSSPGKISYKIITKSGEYTKLDHTIVRLVTPEGLILSLPSISFVKDLSDYLDFSLPTGTYAITITRGNHTTSHTFEYT